MRTLDEVIETASDWTNGFDEMSIEKQMLYYLKEYRSDMQVYAANQKLWEDELVQKIKDFGDAKDRYIARLKELDIGTLNEPLTWDELKTMEGMPVWVEVYGNWYGKFWAFVEVANDAYMNFYQKGQEYPEDLWKRDIGKTWQAYRKRRENNTGN